MSWPEQLLGPLDPRASRKVGRYLLSGPEQKQCLTDFFEKLREGKVKEEYYEVEDIILVYACDHMIWFRDFGDYIDEIEPAYV